MAGDALHDAQLKTLMRLCYILDAGGEAVLGKGAPAIMYQAGRDAGLSSCHLEGRTADADEALCLVLEEGEDAWQVERWQEPGSGGAGAGQEGRGSAWLVFRRCPLISLASSAGTTPGGMLCQAFHGYVAGSMETILGHRVDMRVGHCGPRACKVLLELGD